MHSCLYSCIPILWGRISHHAIDAEEPNLTEIRCALVYYILRRLDVDLRLTILTLNPEGWVLENLYHRYHPSARLYVIQRVTGSVVPWYRLCLPWSIGVIAVSYKSALGISRRATSHYVSNRRSLYLEIFKMLFSPTLISIIPSSQPL